jgi:hypothetical protein
MLRQRFPDGALVLHDQYARLHPSMRTPGESLTL